MDDSYERGGGGVSSGGFFMTTTTTNTTTKSDEESQDDDEIGEEERRADHPPPENFQLEESNNRHNNYDNFSEEEEEEEEKRQLLMVSSSYPAPSMMTTTTTTISPPPAPPSPRAATWWEDWRAWSYPVALQLGIVLSLSGWGLMQERIMTQPYAGDESDDDDEYFKDALFLVCANRLVTALFATLWIVFPHIVHRERLSRSIKALAPRAPWRAIAICAVANTIASSCQYQALRYVSFILQTLSKCAKVPPVMLWGFFLLGKRYPAWEVGLMATICAGCALFLISGSVVSAASRHVPYHLAKSHHHSSIASPPPPSWNDVGNNNNSDDDTNKGESQAALIGIILLVLYMTFDGFTSSYQDHIFRKFRNLTTANMVLHSTTIAFIFSFASLVVGGNMDHCVYFALTRPGFAAHVAWLSLFAATSQFFIFETIRRYGALNFAVIMTTRQVVSVLLSCIVYHHQLTIGQWISMIFVFGPIYVRAKWKAESEQRGRSKSRRKDTDDDTEIAMATTIPVPKSVDERVDKLVQRLMRRFSLITPRRSTSSPT
ncbi:adenosine 3'-phospho 5'-phosphosulfate transporter [Pycnococcus provasolii]